MANFRTIFPNAGGGVAWWKRGPKSVPPSQRARQEKKRKAKDLMHTDAAFDEVEIFDFITGMVVMCRSTWIATAQWDEENLRMTLTTQRTGKAYPFEGMTYEKAMEFAQMDSKGKWYHAVWLGKYSATAAVSPEDLPASHPILSGPFYQHTNIKPGVGRRILG